MGQQAAGPDLDPGHPMPASVDTWPQRATPVRLTRLGVTQEALIRHCWEGPGGLCADLGTGVQAPGVGHAPCTYTWLRGLDVQPGSSGAEQVSVRCLAHSRDPLTGAPGRCCHVTSERSSSWDRAAGAGAGHDWCPPLSSPRGTQPPPGTVPGCRAGLLVTQQALTLEPAGSTHGNRSQATGLRRWRGDGKDSVGTYLS